MEEQRKKCNRCNVNLTLDKFKKKRNDEYQKRCIECNAKFTKIKTYNINHDNIHMEYICECGDKLKMDKETYHNHKNTSQHIRYNFLRQCYLEEERKNNNPKHDLQIINDFDNLSKAFHFWNNEINKKS
eukprot:Lithocolla_globosa_v1_NODE_6244_length_1115_cov_32.149718.p1 type:complete len:129 gc:universal NODE_6244_length_1115_cov_32.149718:390-776(+)